MSEQVLEPATLTDEVLDETAVEPSVYERLPFSFASAHGVMLEELAPGLMPRVLHRPGLTLDVLLELQRIFGPDLVLEELPAEDFQKRLTREYQSGDGAAQRAAEDLGNEFDLSSMADDLADRTDLLAGDDRSRSW